jgi:hypothetical protein
VERAVPLLRGLDPAVAGVEETSAVLRLPAG